MIDLRIDQYIHIYCYIISMRLQLHICCSHEHISICLLFCDFFFSFRLVGFFFLLKIVSMFYKEVTYEFGKRQ